MVNPRNPSRTRTHAHLVIHPIKTPKTPNPDILYNIYQDIGEVIQVLLGIARNRPENLYY